MRIPRPSVRLPLLGRKSSLDAPEVGPPVSDGDSRLLRETRLRLIAVSGFGTLLILVILGVAIYGVVSTAIQNSEQTAFTHYTDRWYRGPHQSTSPEAAELGGEGANIFYLFIAADGTVFPPYGSATPPGLPDQASLKAALANPSGIDERSVTTPDGTPWHVMSVPAYDVATHQRIGTVQFAQNLSTETKLLNTLLWVLFGGGLAALLISLLAGYLYAGRALIPIRESIVRRQAALMRQREFAANASHELRTPLTVIGASVEDLKRNRKSKVEDVGEALGDIEAEVRHMTALVEDMLLLARTDSGVVEIERIPVDLGDIAAEAASMLATLGQDRGVKVVLDPLPAQLSGDPLRLRQLVTILADNAIRHSPAGSTVEIRVRPAENAAVLQVDDNGHGIRPEDLPRLFERFWRADDAPAGGTGLGLAIAKWIVDQHGGRIGALNRPDGGASFRVWLPNHPAQARPDGGRVNIGAGAIGTGELGDTGGTGDSEAEVEPPEV
ncbi:MAG TPA: HAMP domain-containing sensor histidine kinase [Candidatus Limnocylindrales bacterium]